MTCLCTCNTLYFSGSCPEPVSEVTINQVTATINSLYLAAVLVATGYSDKTDVQFSVMADDALVTDGHYVIRVWQSDTDDPTDPVTINPFDVPGGAQDDLVTTSGVVTWRLEGTGTKYVHASIGGKTMEPLEVILA
jgi:hypothetical protein